MPSLLLVDGDANFRRALAVALRLDGAHVGEAADVAEALVALERQAFEAVLVDLLVPGARTLLRHLEDGELARAVVCSPHPESLAAVAADIPLRLLKPFDARQLLAVVALFGMA